MKAVILAAGKGTRLLPLTLETPKTLVEISGKPIIEHIIDSLPESIDEVIIVVSHLKDKIQEHLGNNFKNKNILYTEQGDTKGTFGAIMSAKELIKDGEKFLVTNGDDIHSTDEFIECLKYPRSMAVQKKIMPNYYCIQIKDGDFSGFRAQTSEEKERGALVATGVYVLDSEIFKAEPVLLTTGEYGLPQTVLTQTDRFPVKVIEVEGWLPINSHEDVERAEEYFSSK